MQKSRVQYIEIAKFLCLVLMVYCHMPCDVDVFRLSICSFHMPLFFFAGGLFFSPERFNIAKGIRTLLVPFFFFNLLVFCLNTIVALLSSFEFSFASIYEAMLGTLIGSSRKPPFTMPSGPTWFLVAYFLLKLSASWILSLKNRFYQIVCIIMPVVIALILRDYTEWQLWSWDSAALGSIFFYVAFFFRQELLLFFQSSKFLLFVPLFAVISCFASTNGQVDLFAVETGDYFFFFLIFGFSGIFTIIGLCRIFTYLSPFFIQTMTIGATFIIGMNIWLLEYVMLAYRKFILNDLFFSMRWFENIGILVSVLIISFICIRVMMHFCPCVLGRTSNSKL